MTKEKVISFVTNLLDCSNTIVCNKDLWHLIRSSATSQMRKKLTFVITVCPPCDLTKSVTFPAGAFSNEFPPVIVLRTRSWHKNILSLTNKVGDFSMV